MQWGFESSVKWNHEDYMRLDRVPVEQSLPFPSDSLVPQSAETFWFLSLPSVVDLRLLPSALTHTLLWQEELEHLNQASEEINQVELQLDVSVSFLTAVGWSLEISVFPYIETVVEEGVC